MAEALILKAPLPFLFGYARIEQYDILSNESSCNKVCKVAGVAKHKNYSVRLTKLALKGGGPMKWKLNRQPEDFLRRILNVTRW